MPTPTNGRVAWIGLRSEKKGVVTSVDQVTVHAGTGLEGDHFSQRGPQHRQVTFMQQEHLPIVADWLGMPEVLPEMTRRNVLVAGINLLSFAGQTFQIGDAVFECTGPCDPCQRMNTTIGSGALEAMAGHGGITARVVCPGTICVGSEVTRLVAAELGAHMPDVGLTHIALPVTDLSASLRFYEMYANMRAVHRRASLSNPGKSVAWISDNTRPFVIVLLEVKHVDHPLLPVSHLGVACESRAEVDRLCGQARQAGVLLKGPTDSGPPVGYWAMLSDPDGHTLELSFGQEVKLTVETSADQD